MSDDIKKSNYGPAGTAAAAQYQPHVNQERKARNTGEHTSLGANKNVKAYSSKPGQLSAKQQAEKEMSPGRIKKLSGPVKTLTSEEIGRIKSQITPISEIKKDEMIEVEPDGKREIVEGAEPLKKDPKNRWKKLKKALHHDKAFMDLEDAMGADEEAPAEPEQQAQPQGDPTQELQQELSPEEGQEQPQQGADDQAPGQLEAVSGGQEDDQAQPNESGEAEEGNGDPQPDPQELIDSLKEEGYSDQEIAYIVHGHHAPEVDPTKQAKAQATGAMSDVDIENARAMAGLERQHAEASMSAEREHKKRMSDLEFEQAQKKHGLVDQDAEHKKRMSDLEYQHAQGSNPASMEQEHKKRMLDLEYEKAKKESEAGDASGNAAADKEMKKLEVEKKKLELRLREEEMKLELEFKKREHELKLKMMEQQIKEQGKQKSEISGIKHQQKLVEAKNPPKEKKPLKKSEDEDE